MVRYTERLPDKESGKLQVQSYWNQNPCGARLPNSERYTRAYYDEQEALRYNAEPEIFAFAQFTRAAGQRVLEVGVGMGADFTQWTRAGADAHGLDLTPEAIYHTSNRLALEERYGRPLLIADCESIPFRDSAFDLVYSFGVIQHTLDPRAALAEIMRVTRVGGSIKVMVYHRRSLNSFYHWLRYAALRGKPRQSFAQVLAANLQGPTTKAYTTREIKAMLRGLPVCNVRIRTALTAYDRLDWVQDRLASAIGRGRRPAWLAPAGNLLRGTAASLASVLGDRAGWWVLIEGERT